MKTTYYVKQPGQPHAIGDVDYLRENFRKPAKPPYETSAKCKRRGMAKRKCLKLSEIKFSFFVAI